MELKVKEKLQTLQALMGNNEELFIGVPFMSRYEFTDVMRSPDWSDRVNITRLAATFPEFYRTLSQMDKTDFADMVYYVDSFSGKDRIVGLLSSSKYGTLMNAITEGNLLSLGYKAQEVFAIKNMTEAVCSRHTDSIGNIFAFCSSHREPFRIFELAMRREAILFHGERIRTIAELKEHVRFLLVLQKLGFSKNAIYQNAANAFVSYMPAGADIPNEGLMVHLSATNKADYKDLIESIVPDLIKFGAAFKVLNLSWFDQMYADHIQAGKAITIYESPSFNARGFFRNHPELLLEQGYRIIGDKPFCGRVTGRYGSFIGHPVTDPRTGFRYEDDPTKPFPGFVRDITLNDFICGCEGVPFRNFEALPWMQMQYAPNVIASKGYADHIFNASWTDAEY